MQLILETETIDILDKHTKMSDVDVQQPLDDKIVPNGLLDNINSCEISSNGDTTAEKNMKELAVDDAKYCVENAKHCVENSNEIIEENGISEDTNRKEKKEESNHDNSTEDQNSNLPKENGNFYEHLKTEDKLDTAISSKHDPDAKNIEIQNESLSSSVEKHSIDKKADIPVENLEKSISTQTKTTPLINDCENCDNSKLATPEESEIEKDISLEKNSEKKKELPISEPEKNTKIESIKQETAQNTVQIEVKPIKEGAEVMDQSSTLQADLIEDNLDNSMQSMEQGSVEMITESGLDSSKIKEKEIILETDIANQHSDENKRDLSEVVQMEQEPLTNRDDSMIGTKINENEDAIQETKINSEAVAVGENSDKQSVELLGDKPMEQELSSQTDIPLIETKNDFVVQVIETISEAIVDKEKTNNVSILPVEEPLKQKSSTELDCSQVVFENDEKNVVLPEKKTVLENAFTKENSTENEISLAENQPMEQNSTSQVDVIEGSLSVTEINAMEVEIKHKETESPEDINRDQVSENDPREQQLTSPVNKIASPESDFENEKKELDTTTNNLTEAIEADPVQGKGETSVESAEKNKIIEENEGTIEKSNDNCKPKSGGLIVKSPTEINKISLNAEIEGDKTTNDLDKTESSEIGQNNENNLPGSPVRDEEQDVVIDKYSKITEKPKDCVDVNDKNESSKLETDTFDKESSSSEERIISDQNEDTAFTLNDSDDECQVIKPKDKNKSPSKTEEILDTIIACMEVDRGDKKKIVETAEIDITEEKTDVPREPEVPTKRLCNLSNTLDILSDDDDEPENKVKKMDHVNNSEQNSINIDDDDDVMLIDEDPIAEDNNTEAKTPKTTDENENPSVVDEVKKVTEETVAEAENNENSKIHETEIPKEKDTKALDTTEFLAIEKPDISEKPIEKPELSKKVEEKTKPLVPENFLKTFKTNVADMTREDLEDLCLQLIVEGVVDRSNLSEIKTKVKTMSSSMEEWRKKTMMLTKQNRDLQIVLKTVQEEQKKKGDGAIVPLKITRSVGMQVYMYENERGVKRKNPVQTPPNSRNIKNAPSPSPRQQQKPNAQIPVPRLVPATSNSPAKNTKPNTPQVQNTTVTSNSGVKTSNPMQLPSGTRNMPPIKAVEKRPFSSVQSVTVDLTDDEPPSKQQVTTKNAPQPPVRLVAQNQLLTARAQSNQSNGPRKVYIPINSQNQAIRPGQTIMLKSVPPGQGPRPRNARPMVTIPSNGPIRMPRHTGNQRHPAPLPDVTKQQQPPNWKALPPSPDLKISKVENGIVISWKIEGYQEDSYEEIASYQLYAYQETSSPPSTLLWKKIGDVKALPLPMACTLTQFMAGYKYYFAVRAIDVRSRIGPFSLPGSILLLNK